MTLPLSVVMITLNEAHHMRAVLDNLEGFAAKIFVVDSFSNDDTVDIAIERGAHVVQRRFKDFGDQWNYAAGELPIDTPWVMKLDPDERITDRLKESIAEAIAKADADGFSFRRQLWLMGKPLPVYNHVIRIWRHGKCRFSNVIVNEHPIIDGETRDLMGELEHHDSPNLHHWFEKQNHYCTAEAIAMYHGYALADRPRLLGSRLQRRMWMKTYFWNMPGRYALLYLYHLLWIGSWRAGKVGLIWARLRTELYRTQEYKLYEMRRTGKPYELLPTGHGPAHPAAVQAEDPGENTKPVADVSPAVAVEALGDEGAIRHHEQLARGWEKRYERGGFKRRSDYIRDEVLEEIEISGRWLDAGCGSGHFSAMLAARGASVLGVDAAHAMIEGARALASTHMDGHRMRFERIDSVEDLPLEDASFDGLISLSVLEYVPDPARALREFARVLKPGCPAIISLANSRSPVRLANRVRAAIPTKKMNGSAFLQHSSFTVIRKEITPFFGDQGFRIDHVGGFDPVMPKQLGAMAPSLFFVTATREASGS